MLLTHQQKLPIRMNIIFNQLYIADQGMDYLPQTLKLYHDSMQESSILVHATDSEKESRVQAIVCSKKDGHFFQVWGARTDPNFRGKGLMRGLMVCCIIFDTLINGSHKIKGSHSLHYSCENPGLRA